MIIKRVTGGSSKSVALGRPIDLHREGNSVIFKVASINTNSPTFWRVQMSDLEILAIEAVFEKETKITS